MITLNMANKITSVSLTEQHFDTQNDTLTLSILLNDGEVAYDLTGKTITAIFNPSSVESPLLSVVDGKVQLPIKAEYIRSGLNMIQLYVRSGDMIEPAPILNWRIIKALTGTTPAGGDVDIITDLIARGQEAIVNEPLRVQAELDRDTAEGLRDDAEVIRISNEQARVTSEGDASSGRVKAEADRVTAENARVNAEGDATKGRVKAENDRVTAESARASAESTRASFYDGFNTALTGKVDKVAGKGLSTEDYSTAEKSKLAGIEAGATADQLASEVPITDAGNLLVGTNVETALQEIGAGRNFPATNLVTNGDFSNGTTGWESHVSITNIAITSENLTYDVATGNSILKNSLIISGTTGDKFYLRAKVNTPSAMGMDLYLRTSVLAVTSITTTDYGIGDKVLSGIVVASTTFTLAGLHIRKLADSNSGTIKLYKQSATAINLTATFGAGKEPSLAEMDAIMANYPNSWFDGTVNPLLTGQQMYNDKASKVQEAWVTPTLINGWTSSNAQLMKDNFGFVHIQGFLTGTTINTTAFTLPIGYRPKTSQYYSTESYATPSGVVYVNGDGTVTIRAGNLSRISIAVPPFLAEV